MSTAAPPVHMPPRVRVAPSPTGDPHVGTAYVALFNLVYARRHGGKLVIRIEDTDRERSTEGSEQAILDALRWLGLSWDEGPDCGGPFGPYRQSERLASYREHVDRLLKEGHAYRCFCTRERLDEVRRAQAAAKAAFGYDRHCRALDPSEADARAAAGEAHVVRMKVPLSGKTSFHDELRGEIEFDNAQIDDQVILKSDGYPTYHLANVVDDHLMEITDVIRGEEWITSTPKHVLLYGALGWAPPRFYHLGLLRNPDKSKLSKRKNPVSVFHYRDLGYLPQTFLNFLGTLGFSLGDDRERFTLQEMIDGFDWSRVSTGGPVFDQQKLEAFNGDDIRALDDDALHRLLSETVLAPERLLPMVRLAHERMPRLDDFLPYVAFFFGGSLDYGPVLDKLKLKKRTRKEVTTILKVFLDEIERDRQARAFTAEALEQFGRSFCERHEWKTKEVFTLLRLAVTGRTAAPPLFDTMAVCGKDRCRLRIRDVIELLKREPDWA